MGVTPNRGYPYPDLGSPMRITEDLQALAEAYDTDLKSIQDTVQQRVMFRATASAKQIYGTGSLCQLSFDVLEENNGGALESGLTMPRDRFVPLIPGLWAFTATVAYPQWLLIEWVQLQLLSSTLVASSGVTVMPNNTDGNRTLSVTGVQEMSGTGVGNPIIALLNANPTGNRPSYPVFSRSLTGFLLART